MNQLRKTGLIEATKEGVNVRYILREQNAEKSICFFTFAMTMNFSFPLTRIFFIYLLFKWRF